MSPALVDKLNRARFFTGTLHGFLILGSTTVTVGLFVASLFVIPSTPLAALLWKWNDDFIFLCSALIGMYVFTFLHHHLSEYIFLKMHNSPHDRSWWAPTSVSYEEVYYLYANRTRRGFWVSLLFHLLFIAMILGGGYYLFEVLHLTFNAIIELVVPLSVFFLLWLLVAQKRNVLVSLEWYGEHQESLSEDAPERFPPISFGKRRNKRWHISRR